MYDPQYIDIWVVITESQNSRGWKGPLEIIQSSPAAKSGSSRAGCAGSRHDIIEGYQIGQA